MLAPNNASQPSPASFDVGLGSNSIGNTPTGSGQPSAMTQGNSGPQPASAIGGMPRPLLQQQPPNQQQQQNMAPIPMNNSQLTNSNPPISASGASAPGPMNRIPPGGSSLTSGQLQPQQVNPARNIKGSIADTASNLELMVNSCLTFFLT